MCQVRGGGGANAHEPRPWSTLGSQSVGTGPGEAASFPAHFTDESFRG